MASSISAGTSTGTAINIAGDTTGALELKTNNGVTALTIDTSQNLGVGITPSAWGSIYKPIQLGIGGSIHGRTDTTSIFLGQNTYRDSANNYTYLQTGAAGLYQIGSGTHIWFNAASGTAGDTFTFTEAMRITSAGGVSFGSSGTAYGTTGQVLTSNGDAAPTWSSPSASLKTELFTSSSTWTAPAGCTSIYAVVIGGGGGGSGSSGVSGVAGGYGGVGGCAAGYYTVVPNTTYTVTVGVGGAGNNSNNSTGGTGTSSSLGSLLSATGGSGGTSTQGEGASGTGTNGNIYNKAVPFYGVPPFPGEAQRNNQASSTAAVVWSASLTSNGSSTGVLPGSRGVGESNATTNDATGGVGGVVFIQYVG